MSNTAKFHFKMVGKTFASLWAEEDDRVRLKINGTAVSARRGKGWLAYLYIFSFFAIKQDKRFVVILQKNERNGVEMAKS